MLFHENYSDLSRFLILDFMKSSLAMTWLCWYTFDNELPVRNKVHISVLGEADIPHYKYFQQTNMMTGEMKHNSLNSTRFTKAGALRKKHTTPEDQHLKNKIV